MKKIIRMEVRYLLQQAERMKVILCKKEKVRQQPTFPTRVSIIGVRELDFRVRDGNGYSLSTMATGQFNTFVQSYPVSDKRIGTRYKKLRLRRIQIERNQQYGQASRLISIARLCTSPYLHLRPINRIVSPECLGNLKSQGSLILRRASRLDAFSGYPFRT